MKRAAARVALFVFAGALVMGADAAGLFQPERPDRPRIPFTPPERPGEGASETSARRVWFVVEHGPTRGRARSGGRTDDDTPWRGGHSWQDSVGKSSSSCW